MFGGGGEKGHCESIYLERERNKGKLKRYIFLYRGIYFSFNLLYCILKSQFL